jgi:hypothetical protein
MARGGGLAGWLAGWRMCVARMPALCLPPRTAAPAAPLPVPLLQEGQAPFGWFLAVSISTGIGAIFIFTGVMCFCRWKRLI